MTDFSNQPESANTIHTGVAARRRLKARYRSEWIFKTLSFSAIGVSIAFLLFLFTTIFVQGWPAFTYNFVQLPLELNETTIGNQNGISPESIHNADYDAIVRTAIRAQFPQVSGRSAKRALSGLVSPGAPVLLREALIEDPEQLNGQKPLSLPLSDFADLYLKGQISHSEYRTGTAPVNIEASSGNFQISGTALLSALKNFTNPALQGAQQENSAFNAGIALDRDMPSILFYANGGVLKLETLGPGFASARALLPLTLTKNPEVVDWQIRLIEVPEANRNFSDQEIVWTDALVERQLVQSQFNTLFFTKGASREPEMAGILGAVVGTALTLIVTLSLSFPLGVAAAVYLEEFAPRNRWTALVEVNINNLAAVPSIVFGLLGLAVFLTFFGMPRSAPLVGGMVLALMTLPTIIIASRAALRAVPPSIREAALGIGASKMQVVLHHVLPLAMPGILTGTIIGMAQALGETAPLLMIGMVAFVVDIPGGFTDPATVLPVQIFMWADFPEPAFQQRTSAAIMVLLAFLVAMNALAVVLRKQFERRW